MNRILCLTLTALLAAPAFAADDQPATNELTDPVEILRKMDAAAKAISSVSYDTEFTGAGELAKHLPSGKASVVMEGWGGDRFPKKFHVDVEGRLPGAADAKHYTGGCDGENYYLVDHADKTVYEDIDPKVMGAAGQLVTAPVMIEFVHESPFNDEINGKNQTLKGSEKIGDVDCYVIALEYANAPQSTTWYVGKKDFLPRCRTDRFEQPNVGTIEIRRTLTNVVPSPKIGEDTFKLKVPDGFKKSDDFAP